MIFYDIHSHKSSENDDVITIYSIDLGLQRNAVFSTEEVKNRPLELFSAGIHPWHPDASKILELKALAKLKNVVAIGEAGLDKLKNDFEIQKQLFEIQVQIAEETGKPMIIHCVRAWNELLEMKRRFKPSVTWIIHGFRGNAVLASQLMNNGLYLSFGKNFHPEALKKAWEMKRLLIETDDNDVDIREVYDNIAEILSLSISELSAETEAAFGIILSTEQPP
jgi:TatD DNase family protein